MYHYLRSTEISEGGLRQDRGGEMHETLRFQRGEAVGESSLLLDHRHRPARRGARGFESWSLSGPTG